ncbi:hypothetical protein IPT12_15130 [Xanthomonas perforans]|uniref:Uncharacterized protein n=7 Tax=Xanthomonas TaxID=338 RepID=A0AAJ0N5Z4_9XANT|nr:MULTISPECIES: hypothetical protein [Xanthomonas]MEB1846172.1 hypothetical protein [Xanthomonas campestris pv. campestris]APO97757.1 hypothetical protein BJD13_00790 [Xanthomonas perforans]APP78113.1 hypothetical protein BJD12_22520 [Xanthomonas vesicatoria ATCC 35937]APP82580.1 hypothetical protein BJD10_23115 [Xanthomonas hortorum pv. gardneri]APP87295.1 hypothetical protein BI317_24855 [Xanthomonas hortorum pv. gardneri]
MRKHKETLLTATLCAGLLIGCGEKGGRLIEFDGSEAGLRKAVATMAAASKKETGDELKKALDIYLSHLKGSDQSDVDTATPLKALSGITVAEFINQARQIQDTKMTELPADHPTWINSRMVETMQMELKALESNRLSLNQAGYFSLDQLQFNPPSFIPPPDGDVKVANNRAIFAFRMSNATGLTIYKPTFDVRIEVPGEQMPAYTGRLSWNDPIGIPDGTSRLVELTCCSILEQPFLNKRLRQLPEKAHIKAELVGVEDFRKRNPLRTVGYGASDLTRERLLEACVKDIEAHLDTWTPKRSAAPCRALAKNHKTGSEQLADGLQATSNRRR